MSPEHLDECPTVGAFLHSSPGLACLHRLVVALPVVGVEIGACGMRLVCLVLELTGLNRFVGASYGTQQQVKQRVEEASVAYRRDESTRLAQEMPPKAITLTQDETWTGGLCLAGSEPGSHYLVREQAVPAREHDTWHTSMEQALAGHTGRVSQSTSDATPGLLAYVEHHRGAHHSPDLGHVRQEWSTAVSTPMAAKVRAAAKVGVHADEALHHVQEQRHIPTGEADNYGPGRSAQAVAHLAEVAQDVEAAGQEPHRLAGQRTQVAQSVRAIGHAYPFVDVERGVHCHGKLLVSDIHAQMDTIRAITLQDNLSETCLDRLAKAEWVVPKMQATIECVSGSVRRQVPQLALASPQSFAMQAQLIPSYYLERVASTSTVREGAPLRALAECLRASLCEPDAALGMLSPGEQDTLKSKAKTLAEVFQRSSSNVEGRNGYPTLRNHQLRGLDHPRKRACLTAMHNFFLTRPDGMTAAERFCGQKPRSLYAAMLGTVEIPSAPLSPPRPALG